LDSRFTFADDAVQSGISGWTGHLRAGIGKDDGEHYLLRIFRKTGSTADDDLRRLIERGIRPIRRLLSSRRARELLVEVVELIEDDNEIAIVMLDPGRPLIGSHYRAQSRQSALLIAAARKNFWRNFMRLAEALSICHDAGIIHGGINGQAIFSHRDEDEDFRLGGYEACIHIADDSFIEARNPTKGPGPVSFRQDWIDLGNAAAEILGISESGGPTLSAVERRTLDRLRNPPQFQLFNGNVVLRDLKDVVDELERIGSSTEGELVFYPSPQVMQSDLPSLTSGVVDASETDKILGFVENDLLQPGLRVLPTTGDTIRLVTDLAIYDLKILDDFVASLTRAHQRRQGDRIYDAVELNFGIHMSRNRRAAEERVRKLGLGAKGWRHLGQPPAAAKRTKDLSVWYALILLEAFTLLREQFRSYPVEVLGVETSEKSELLWVALRTDTAREARRELMGLRSSWDALRIELPNEDGKTEWTLSKADNLSKQRERLPLLKFDHSDRYKGEYAFAFNASELPISGERFFLRPRTDAGFERAIRRRLQAIVAARRNVDILRAIDDPTQVRFDDALRQSAPPGVPPSDLDESKQAAWSAITEGRSINVVVGPPGVGKTYLITSLVRSILERTPDARILISAQNHETLIHMEAELIKALQSGSNIVVRVERSSANQDTSALRTRSRALLQSVLVGSRSGPKVLDNQRYVIEQALSPVSDPEVVISEHVFRDTDNLLLRSSDVTLATTSSYAIEEMISDGEQFDWVIIEEAARANGSELLGAMLLGNRRVMIGDHNQLSPFDLVQRQKFYDGVRAEELLRTSRGYLSTLPDIPVEVEAALDDLKSDDLLLRDVLASAARLEEPFRSIVDREDERERSSKRSSTIVNKLVEQSRMHPALCDLVSNTFYDKTLKSSARVRERKASVTTKNCFPNAPLVVIDFPALSTVRKRAFEASVNRSYRNETEASTVLTVLNHLTPKTASDGRRPTLAVLSPYAAQVNCLERLLSRHVDAATGTFFGFASPRDNAKFIFTSDSFQGSEADVVVASLVRNNVLIGKRGLGFLTNPQRVNVLLSRARQKLILITSRQFIRDAVEGVDPDNLGPDLSFLVRMLDEIKGLSEIKVGNEPPAAVIVTADDRGKLAL
jgi:hypothetical protein